MSNFLSRNISTIFIMLGHECNLQCKYCLQHDVVNIAMERQVNPMLYNFIIETHSEYLIRKLQFLTASKKVGTDKSIIYYFNADKYVTANEPKVKPIEIRKNGNLSDTFGPGFYDEISRLQFDLMMLNQEQNN